MKKYIENFIKNKLKLIIICLCLLSLTFCLESNNNNNSNNNVNEMSNNQNYNSVPSTTDNLNPNYDGNHSLFSDENKGSGASSNFSLSIPPPKIGSNNENSDYKDEFTQVAERMLEKYREYFDFLDKNANNLISADELALAFEVYDWPKEIDGNVDNIEYGKELITKFDKDNKEGLSFEEFCRMMSSLYDTRDRLEEQKCLNSYDKAIDTMNNFYKWLDQKGTGTIGESELLYGISKMMSRDADEAEISSLLKKNGGTITKDALVLAIANGELDKTFIDPNYYKNYSS